MQNLSLHCTVVVPQPGIEPTAPALQARFLPTGPPAKSLCPLILSYLHMQLAYYHRFAHFSTFMGSRISQVAQWSTCKCGRCRRHGSTPGSGRFPGGGNGNPLQYSCLGNPMERGASRATVHGVTKSRTRSSTHTQNLPPTIG